MRVVKSNVPKEDVYQNDSIYSSCPHKPNTRLNVARNSALTGVSITATEVQVTVSPIEHILTLLIANNATIQSLESKLKTTSEEIAHLKARPEWSITGTFGDEYIKSLALAIVKYFRIYKCCKPVPKSPNAIHVIMKRPECRNILSVDVMSDDESNIDNKVQEFITAVDSFTVKRLKKNAKSLLKRIPDEKETSMPQNLAVTLSEWCFSK
ncbi:hypothetical protein PHYBLDRAFT_148934 [Phycomyces blakesleeanus NRRL 1555(-)]|uniref:Uncharacterized protein n=1 Tax=Phycomyces blakesleeanus (strain ATCC 8743b / DSM 1359 / FGSC 10004 / NBRC 33097 / NRRL 1555) TaxID=763407 RepID=A0A162NHG6_PHYB8|nr:hypothetical protein PHYBLDRAFT_148934 [Phycomyces blakesleeanus NRRL 1555(-)]OAD69744.1 hypothetical protein PHYBLDRAFT_148934 [Phycomyces blakesleeanus NRRL 1555(-)]|eukprot:XP_018287784.1 hypothetical protein PHYBLDRAFT_148934 [Phycomyces blakesleeanus NRRL 1555(-)]